MNTSTTSTAYASGPDIKGVPCLVRFLKVPLIRANPEINFRKWWQRRGVFGNARRQANPKKGVGPFLPTKAWPADATQPKTPRRASPFPSNSFRSAWEAARAQWPVCGVRVTRPRSMDIGL